ncbi:MULTISPECIES: hypothetical protein [Bacillus]|uniref:TolA protein n=1 Tax=Bacillus cereus TaxID=1396 RepID=A0A164L2W1_BACCE|nr:MULTISPECIES: hypothetical protein [Bacillus]KZD54538.1 TolA protein [Bacillus cereus]TSI10046.1 cell division protein ZapC [Bacillus sp. HY001]
MNTLFLLMAIVGFVTFPILTVVFILSFFMKRLKPHKKKILVAMTIGFLLLIIGSVTYEPSPEEKAQAAKQAEEAKKEKEEKAKEKAAKEEKKKAEQQAEKEKQAEEKEQKEAEEAKKKKDQEEAERLKVEEAEKKKAEEEQRKVEEVEKKKAEEAEKKKAEAELTTLPFEEFLNKYYALSVDENGKVYDENIHKKVFTWSGYVADVMGSKVVVNTKQITKPWNEFTGEEQAHTFIASFDNKKELANVKPGDKITVSGSVESRGAYMPEKELYSYWKMYKGKLIK